MCLPKCFVPQTPISPGEVDVVQYNTLSCFAGAEKAPVRSDFSSVSILNCCTQTGGFHGALGQETANSNSR